MQCSYFKRVKWLSELEKQKWAETMKNLLIEIKKEVDLSWNTANSLTLDKIESFESKYYFLNIENNDFLFFIDFPQNST